MTTRILWQIAGPVILLGSVLLALGAFAAWNVHKQHQVSSQLIAREVNGLIATEELHLVMREIRYQLNMFLRSRDRQLLGKIVVLHAQADSLLSQAKELPYTDRERSMFEVVREGYQRFFEEYQRLTTPALEGTTLEVTPELLEQLTTLSDVTLTEQVLDPLVEFLTLNEQVVERTSEANRATAQHLKIGFLLLGICGGVSGLLMGMGLARAIGRSIVQLDVSVRGAAGKLADVTGPVTFSHTGDLAGLESGLKRLEDGISDVVERLQAREVELLRSEQLMRVGQLAAGLAHELRNPLMPMKVLVQAAMEREEGLKGRALRVIDDEIARMEKSIQSFLDFARPPAVEKTLADLREIVQQAVELVRGRADQQFVDVRVALPSQTVTSKVDRTQLCQLLLNLLLNALDVLAQGGRIEVELIADADPPDEEGEPQAAVTTSESLAPGQFSEHEALRLLTRPRRAETARPWFGIRIADNGPGIPPELAETLFEPFVTTKETGTGLGLSICQRIAAAHQGALRASNAPAGGAVFELLLPYES